MQSKIDKELNGILLSLFIMISMIGVFFSVLINNNKETKYICYKQKSNLVLMTKNEFTRIKVKNKDISCKVIRINEEDFNIIRTQTLLKD